MKKILIIEDDNMIQDLYAIIFNGRQYEVKQVYNGQEGLDIIDEFQPDIVLLDLVMPVMDGETFLLKYYERNNNSIQIPILIASTDVEKATLLVKQYDKISYLKKTLKKEVLFSAIKDLLI